MTPVEPASAAGRDLQEAVYYHEEDCASHSRRVASQLIDLVFLLFLVLDFPALCASLFPEQPGIGEVLTLAALAFAPIYLIVLKRSRWGTLGYRLCGVRLVDYSGRPPSIAQMVCRFFLGFGVASNPFVDLFWTGGSCERQGLRDLFTHTYVVRRGAVPAGRGRVVEELYFFLGMALTFAEVERPPGSGSPGRGPAAAELLTPRL